MALPSLGRSGSAGPRGLGYSVTLEPGVSADALEPLWHDLDRRAAASFFQSWGWVGTWLRSLPAHISPILVSARAGSDLVGLGIVVERHDFPRLLSPRTGHLHATGDRDLDEITIEWNGFRVDPDHRAAIPAMLAGLVEEGGFDRLDLPGVAPDYVDAEPPPGFARRILTQRPAFSLILPASSVALERSVSANTRQQVRRAQRAYSALGPLRVIEAQNVDEAHLFLTRLKELHQPYWTARGKRGAFSGGFFESFHRRLIATCFAAGEIELLRIAAADRTIGYLYNFRHRQRVYAYQSGFDYALIDKGKPGLVAHWLAIERARGRGDTAYDFLAGENQLKRQLSDREDTLHWLALERGSIRFAIGDLVLRAGRRARRMIAP